MEPYCKVSPFLFFSLSLFSSFIWSEDCLKLSLCQRCLKRHLNLRCSCLPHMDGETVQFHLSRNTQGFGSETTQSLDRRDNIVCFPHLRKSLVLVNSRIQGSDYDDDDDEDDDDDGRWGVGKGEWFKSGHGLCPMSDPNPLASRIMLCGISELFPFLCGTSTFYNDAPAAGQTNQACDRRWTRGQCRDRNTWKKHSNHTGLAGALYLVRQKVSPPVPYKCCMTVFIIAGSKSIMQ